jgi:membrane-associated protease RseP (regulator of RpoE activity)
MYKERGSCQNDPFFCFQWIAMESYPTAKKDRGISFLHVFLFVVTLGTTLAAGALQQGVNPLEEPGRIWLGLPFSLALLLILGAHEFGHYFMSRRHDVDVTLPYFIPAPSFIGTFGAFIKMKSPIMDRRILLDIGVAGPLAGVVVAVPVILVGLVLSDVTTGGEERGLTLGTSILFSFLNWIVHGSMPDEVSLILHPVAFSGWIGLLITSLNLLPVGQLDGGHVAYAIFGSRQRTIAQGVMAILLFLGIAGWSGWLVWVALLFFLGIHHPPVVYEWVVLDGKRRMIGWLTLILFVVTFTPVPF